LNHWGLACLVLVLSSILFAARGMLGVFYSSFLANILAVSGIAMMHHALRRFSGHTKRRHYYLVLIATLAVLLVGPTFIRDDYRMRVIIVSAINAGLFFASASVIQSLRNKSFAEYFTQYLFLATAAVSAFRCAAAIKTAEPTQPMTDASSIQYVYLATFSFSILALSLGFIMMVNRKLLLKLETAASHDGLTRVSTRSAFFDLANKELARSRRSGEKVSLLMIDLDDFKSINDRFGHHGGDQVLIDFVARTNQVLRSRDLFGRYGGEEFVVLLPASDRNAAHQVATRVCAEARKGGSLGAPLFTVSIGVTTIAPTNEHLSVFFSQADTALYRAKAAGKNRVEHHHQIDSGL